MSLPTFPTFKRLELDDKESVEAITSGFPPYSDHNFTSLWSWDTENSVQVSDLNGNVVFLMSDYLTKDPLYTFIGKNNVDETIEALLTLSNKNGFGNTLKMIPKDVVECIASPDRFKIVSDRDNFDYIIDVSGMLNLHARKNKSLRKRVEAFEKKYGTKVRTVLLDAADSAVQHQLFELFDTWATKKTNVLPQSEIDSERIAIQRLLTMANPDIQVTGVFIESLLVGFSIEEILGNGFAIGHFMKANIKYDGAFQYLDHQVNLNLNKHGVRYINIEQDMGLEQLRTSKMGHHPAMFLEKFSISAATD